MTEKAALQLILTVQITLILIDISDVTKTPNLKTKAKAKTPTPKTETKTKALSLKTKTKTKALTLKTKTKAKALTLKTKTKTKTFFAVNTNITSHSCGLSKVHVDIKQYPP